MRVRHYMTANPTIVKPSTTVAEIAHLFIAHRIGCVPVVDDRGTLVGLVTETDLFIREKVVPFSLVRAPSLMGDWLDPKRLEETYQVRRDLTAKDVMTRQLLTVDADAPVGDAAHLMMRNERKHLPVTAAGRLVGILTRQDVLRALMRKRAGNTSKSSGRLCPGDLMAGR
jgi:CBS domain-containing protein